MAAEVNVKLKDFYNYSPREFNNIVLGVRKRELEHLKTQMYLFRDLEFAVISPYLDKKHNIKSPQQYKPFAFEKDQLNNELKERKFKTKAEHEALWKKIDNQQT